MSASSQAYVYRSKLKWYILHPEQIETPQLYQARWWWWRASVFHVDGVHFVGNGKAQLAQLKLYPEQKHEESEAVRTPLPWIPIVPTGHLKFSVKDDHAQDVSKILTSQPYVYRSKLKWYILHPGQIEAPQLHQARWWWRASVFHVDGKHFVGNGNHRGIQVKGASHRRGVEHFFAIASIRSCAKRVGRRGLRITKNRRHTKRLLAQAETRSGVEPQICATTLKIKGLWVNAYPGLRAQRGALRREREAF